MYVPSSSDPIINLAPGVKAPHSASSSSPVALERFRRPTKVLPCCSVMTSVARPPRRPSTLAIRSRWPVHVPTRDTESAPSTGAATRMAKVAAHKRAFKLSLHGSKSGWAPRTNCFVLSSPHQAQKCQLFGVPVFQRDGAPEEIRTPDPQIRSLVLYPAELRALVAHRAGNAPGSAKAGGNGPFPIGFPPHWQVLPPFTAP